jgi:hypothetical protein
MKNTLTFLVLLFIPLGALAQSEHKNELSVGYFSAGEFFDETPFKTSAFSKGKNISVNYTRLMDKNLSVGLTYARCGFQYVPIEVPRYNLDPYTTEFRLQRTFTANIGLKFSLLSLTLRGKAGIRYNQRSTKVVHTGGGWHSGLWYESFGIVDRYGRLGASMGLSLTHPIFWRIFGELDSEFAKMFTRADRNQLLLSYRIGIRF